MTALPIAQVLQAALPWLSPRGRAVISALVATRGRLANANQVATWIGVEGRFRLGRLLRREGLPALMQLANWICVLHLVLESESTGQPLLQLTREAGMDPATCYRRVKRSLGVPWSEARANGFAWALVRFLDCCHRPAARPKPGVRGAGEPDAASRPNHAWRSSLLAPMTGGHAVTDTGRTGPQRASLCHKPLAQAHHPLGRVAATVPLSGCPFGVAISCAGVVYITRARTATLERFDLRTGRFMAPVGVGCNPTRVAFDRHGLRAYVTNQFGDSISVIDVRTNRRIDEIPVFGDPAPVLVAPDGQSLYVTTNADRLLVINLTAKRTMDMIPLPATSHHLTLDHRGRRLYVATRSAGSVLEIDTLTHQLLRTLAVGGRTQALAVAADGSELYVANELGGLDVVDLTLGCVTASIALGGPAFGLALSPDNAQLYVGLVDSERVQVVDRQTLRLAATIPTGGIPREIAFHPSGQTAVIVNEAGWIDVVA